METYIVHISDAGSTDCRVPVVVNEQTTLAHAVQEALEEFEAERRGELEFPLFLDIHPASEFAGVNSLYNPR